MIVLDTNVVSEPLKPKGTPAVRDWLDRQAVKTLYLTSISLAELSLGLELLPAGKRREELSDALTELLTALFGGRILPFDDRAAHAYASLAAAARGRGETLSFADGQIAAIAAVNGFSVATRDIRPFAAAGVPVINPWEA